jgi:gliding motility-associated lipoprotein GldH
MRMRWAFALALALSACDQDRVYELNYDFDKRYWLAGEQPEFEFEITDTTLRYNLYCNIRNSVSYPYSRLFLNYSLQDSSGKPLLEKMTQTFLFDKSTGKPQGSSGLGDIYDQRIFLTNHQFTYSGKYKMKFEQYMRMDTLPGVLAVGLRVEKGYLDK